MIVGAIFDLDGTILDSMPAWEHAPERYLTGLGIDAEPGLGKTMFSMSMKEGAEYLKNRYGLEEDLNAIIEGVNRAVIYFYHERIPLKEGASDFLSALKQAGVKITAATASDRHIVEKALNRLKAIDYFDRIFTCTEVGAGKAKPDIYLAAAGHMGTLPRDTWVFEDSLYAIKTAKDAGFRTVGVYDASSAQDRDEIRKICDIYLEKLDNADIFLK